MKYLVPSALLPRLPHFEKGQEFVVENREDKRKKDS
jgi:hypothetical protein